MQGDFSRDSFDPKKHYRRVLMQQGRPILDSDLNEQQAIETHHFETLIEDLIGPHGGPEARCGFEINRIKGSNDFRVGTGNYYINGMRCRNEEACLFTQQPYLEQEELLGRRYLIYLEAWERGVTAAEDDSIREEALRGADTATRSQVVWQVKALGPDEEENEAAERLSRTLEDLLDTQDPDHLADRAQRLLEEKRIEHHRKRAKMAVSLSDSGYRGTENQLYRVEIHKSGVIGYDAPTIKWARNNASLTFPIVRTEGSMVKVEHLGEVDRPLEERAWVEITDQERVTRDDRRLLLQVERVYPAQSLVELAVPDGMDLPVYGENSVKRPLLRKWDSQGAMPIEAPNEPIELEGGLEVRFGEEQLCFEGDYWLIEARAGAASGVGRRSRQEGQSEFVPPHGLSRRYAPLAVVSLIPGEKKEPRDCRRRFRPFLVSPPDEVSPPVEPPPPERKPHWLYLFGEGFREALEDTGFLKVGRDETKNSIVIDEDVVSSEHAKISREGDEIILEQYEEVTNANTYVKRLDKYLEKGEEVQLEPGDEIWFGETRVELSDEPPEARRSEDP